MSVFDDINQAVNKTFNAVTEPLSDLGKKIGLSALTDPFLDLGGKFLSNDAGMFLARVWTVHGQAFFNTPQAFIMLGPIAPALGILVQAAPSLVKQRADGLPTDFSIAFGQQSIWAMNTALEILPGVSGIKLPTEQLQSLTKQQAEIIKRGSDALREMKSYGVDIDKLSEKELAKVAGTDRLDLALLARAAVTEGLSDLQESKRQSDILRQDAVQAQAAAATLPGGSNMPAIRRVSAGGAVLSADDAASMLVTLGFMTDIQRKLAAQGATSVSGSAGSPLGRFLAYLGKDPRVVAAATLNGSTSDMLRAAYETHVSKQKLAQMRAASAEKTRGVQQRLAALGYPVAVDGIEGPKTLAAIKLFQASAGLAADGKVGPLTEAALAETYRLKTEQGAVAQIQAYGVPGLVPTAAVPTAPTAQQVYEQQLAAYNAQQAQAQAASTAAASPVAVAIGGGVGLGVALAAGLAAPIALPVAAIGGLLGWLATKR